MEDSNPLTYPVKCSALKKGGYVVIEGRPCRITDISTSENGEVKLDGMDIFNGKKYKAVSSSNDNMDVPNVSRRDLQVVDISDDGYINLIDDDGTSDNTMKIPTDAVGDDIREKFDNGENFVVTVLYCMNEALLVGTKVLTS
ncbi:hypothetical protein MBANPS3_004916 [Mucor bainieri]